MNPPIIFIHYGNSYCLKYTLESARLFNTDKRIILLGDNSNSHYGEKGIEHFNYNDFSSSREIELFDKVFTYIAGKLHNRPEWTRFIFKRWFIIYNFILINGIQTFWTFDSDNLILTDLSEHEDKFLKYDCTEQCSGICMNGFITNIGVVKGYIDKINELFQRPEFLTKQKEIHKHTPRYAFTEMRAYIAYREESQFTHMRLNTIINGETFLDSICTVEEHKLLLNDDEYEIYDKKYWGHNLKKIYLHPDGNIFMRHRQSQKLVKLNSINMSWVPECLSDTLLSHAKRKLKANRLCWFRKPKIRVLEQFESST